MKRKMKPLFALTLCATILTVSLAGCGQKTTEGGASPAPEASTAASGEPAADASAAPEETEVPFEEAAFHSLFPGGDLKGATITILDSNDIGGKNPDTKEDATEKEEAQAKLDFVEKKYNVNFEFVPMPTKEWKEIPKALATAYASGKPAADVIVANYQHVGALVANDLLYDLSALKETLPFKDAYKPDWFGKYYGPGSAMGGEGLYYNMDMIRNAGMEKTPAEMFAEGKWSYDDCYNYLVELKSKLKENEYPIMVDPYYWMLFAPAANGQQILQSDGKLNYTSDAMLETLGFLKKLIDAGLCKKADKDAEGAWDGYGSQNKFDTGTEITMAHRAAWQAGGVAGKFEVGFAPYPWGSEVTVGTTGKPDSYTTLSENYHHTYFDGQMVTLRNGIDQVADPQVLLMAIIEFMEWNWMLKDDVPAEVDETDFKWFDNELDFQIYQWATERQAWERYNSLKLPDGRKLQENLYDVYYGNKSLRSVCESALKADTAGMKEAGLIK